MLGITFKAFNERFTSLARIAKQELMHRNKGTWSTNKGYISGTSSKNYDQLKNLIYREDDQIRQESIANQETLQEEEEAKGQEFYEGVHDRLFNDDLVENMKNIELEKLEEFEEFEEFEENEVDADNTKEGKHKECLE